MHRLAECFREPIGTGPVLVAALRAWAWNGQGIGRVRAPTQPASGHLALLMLSNELSKFI